MSGGVVLSLFDHSCNMVKPWAEAGYPCVVVDLRHPPGVTREGNIIRVGADILRWNPPKVEYAAAFAAPPCTDLAASGRRWFQSKGLRALIDALTLFHRAVELCEATGAPWCVENPVGVVSTHWRKPDFYFNPCDYAGYADEPYAEAYTKRTCLWVGGGFRLPTPRLVPPVRGSAMHHVRDASERSVTPMGFARAVYEANRGA